ncbi:hypothetical protein CHS0354_025877 [Potamilus streckersoni]|uniref:Uncharacterized protein n=1 Tax=Potamilus streckersoni TaxID=2493646 RepID=A0AAE0TJ86_9BIVA|nr:hypothetical protein CHS0354_025877 [Potamilus streckersoni]
MPGRTIKLTASSVRQVPGEFHGPTRAILNAHEFTDRNGRLLAGAWSAAPNDSDPYIQKRSTHSKHGEKSEAMYDTVEAEHRKHGEKSEAMYDTVEAEHRKHGEKSEAMYDTVEAEHRKHGEKSEAMYDTVEAKHRKHGEKSEALAKHDEAKSIAEIHKYSKMFDRVA